MNKHREIKPSDAIIRRYYEHLQELKRHGATTESSIRPAFQNLLESAAKMRDWTLIPELGDKAKGRIIRPDGTCKDQFGLIWGHWEAKDPSDNLEREITAKTLKGYPLFNTIFENSLVASLFQNGNETMRVDLSRSEMLAALLNEFLNYLHPNYKTFGEAVEEFRGQIPEIAGELQKKIQSAHGTNGKFQYAFKDLFDLCRKAINPNIRREAVDEMLIQHMLTERLIREIFNPDFLTQNVIAAEIEKAIQALTGPAFSHRDFLKSLDRFYVAIEDASRLQPEFRDRIYLLNTVYERFFRGYAVKVADTHGIIYTPQEIVEFICASVVSALAKEFGKDLSSPDVLLIDPAVGTGSFIVEIMNLLHKRNLERFYKEHVFANEVMLMPYYIASLNIEHAYYELSKRYEAFPGLCFVDTLDMGRGQGDLYITKANTERIERERKADITVIIGNPPYNAHQLNENDNNKNRNYEHFENRIRETYAASSMATNKSALWDPYVKFFRWATDRLEARDGIICFITNNSFLDGYAFDGMRKRLLQDFNRIWHLDLRGNLRKGQREGNVFDIMVSVGITIAIRNHQHKDTKLFYCSIPAGLTRAEKLHWLQEERDYTGIKWKQLKPDKRHSWLRPRGAELFDTFMALARIDVKRRPMLDAKCIFINYGPGLQTNRDAIIYNFNNGSMKAIVARFVEDYNAEVDRYKQATKEEKKNIDAFVNYDKILWCSSLKAHLKHGHYAKYDESHKRASLYRPFAKKILYFDDLLIHRVSQFPRIFPTPKNRNTLIALSEIGHRTPFHSLVSDTIIDLHPIGTDSSQCFPFYTYNEDGTRRRENITNWALAEYRKHYGEDKITKWDIFFYVYGILNHPAYRETFAECLKRDLPRIPFAPDFWAFSKAGKELAEWHLNYEKVKPYPLKFVDTPGIPLTYQVEKMRLSKDKKSIKVNESLTLTGIPDEVFEYRLGTRSALVWVIDQYQVKTDKRTGIVSDPNRPDDPEYIVRLIGQVVRVSLETVRIVKGLPEEWHS